MNWNWTILLFLGSCCLGTNFYFFFVLRATIIASVSTFLLKLVCEAGQSLLSLSFSLTLSLSLRLLLLHPLPKYLPLTHICTRTHALECHDLVRTCSDILFSYQPLHNGRRCQCPGCASIGGTRQPCSIRRRRRRRRCRRCCCRCRRCSCVGRLRRRTSAHLRQFLFRPLLQSVGAIARACPII